MPTLPDRVLVYGVTGSGKTTLARRIAERTGRDWISVDDLTWDPNWTQVPDDEQRRRFQEICAREEWIMDTAYGKWLDVPLARVQLIVALDYPRWISLGRLFKRTMVRLVDGKPVCNGNRETLRNFFSREAILLWHFRSFHNKRRRIAKWEAEFGPEKVLRFRSPKSVEAWLQSIEP